jgi:putative NIF3 family GTP cyclohydrolase 1 type 2
MLRMKKNDLSRRKFLHLAGIGLTGMGLPAVGPSGVGLPFTGRTFAGVKTSPGTVDGDNLFSLTAGDVIDRVKAQVGVPWKTPTVDTIKGGNAGNVVTGITTTFMATLDVIQRSAAAGRNMIITHEPIFWNNLDLPDGLTDNPLYRHKMEVIDRGKLVVWRFHDHWHARSPDGIMEGQHQALGWDRYRNVAVEGINNGVFELPQTMTLREFAEDVARNLQSDNTRVIGNPATKINKVCNTSNHLRGSVEALPFADAFIIKEADRENDLAEWCRDTVLSGQQKGFVFISHNRGEEFGMVNCARWLRTFIPELPVEFIASGDPFWRTGTTTSLRTG